MLENEYRGQTEPLAALAAVAMIAIGVGIYGMYITDTLTQTSDQSVVEPTMQRVWSDIQTNGVYKEIHDPLDSLPEAALPRGEMVYIKITYVDSDGQEILVSEVCYDKSASQISPPGEIPDTGNSITRPVAVALEPGNVTAGTLEVVVW